MDVQRVIGEVAARHGVRLDADDPALVLVTVAELMLAEARAEFLAAARGAGVRTWRGSAGMLVAGAGVFAAGAVVGWGLAR